MNRETKTVDLGMGFTADIVTYLTQGDRRAIEQVWADTAKVGQMVEKRMENGQMVERVMDRYMTSPEYGVKAQNALLKAAVMLVGKDNIALQGDIITACMGLPDACFKTLVKALNALTPPEDEKKAETAPTSA